MTFKPRLILPVSLTAAALMIAGTFTAFAGNLRGDADIDRKISVKDVTCIQRTLAGLPVGDSFSETAADADGNGKLEISDATAIQRWLAEFDSPFAIGEELTDPPAATEATTQSPTDEQGWGRIIFQP